MGIMSWITGGSKASEKAVEAVINTGDALFFTDEEKSVAAQKKLDWMLEYYKATAAQNVARRVIAVMVTGMFILLILSGITAYAFDRMDLADYIFKTMNENLKEPFMIIIGFYFLKHVLGNIKK